MNKQNIMTIAIASSNNEEKCSICRKKTSSLYFIRDFDRGFCFSCADKIADQMRSDAREWNYDRQTGER
jgi:hypothetical protein